MEKYQIEISSPMDRKNLVAEIWKGDELIAEINSENGTLELEIYTINQKVNVSYEAFVNALIQAKERLIEENEY